MPNIFLSHSSLDKDLAGEIKKQIEAEIRDAEVFVSSEPDAIPSGEWLPFIVGKLNWAEVLIPLITPHSDKSMWVAVEYGYFWSCKGKDAIYPLRHPKADIPSPLDTIQGKKVTDEAELEVHFTVLCKHFGQSYEKRANLKQIVEAAHNLQVVTQTDREKQAEGRRLLKSAESSQGKQAVLDWMKSLNILHDAQLQWLGDLQGVEFVSVNMQRIDLGGNNLRGAKFWDSDLEGAKLGSAQLQGADFQNVTSLEGASFQGALLDETTTLKDGNLYRPELGLEQLRKFGVVIDH